MSTLYIAQIEQGQENLKILLKKVEACKKRINTLIFLASESQDSIDKAIDQELNIKKPRKAKNITGRDLQLMKFLGAEGKTLDEAEEYLKQIGKDIKRTNLRNLLMNLRRKKHYVASARAGFYNLTELGINYVNKNTEVVL